MNWYKKSQKKRVHSLALPLEEELSEKGHLDYDDDENLWFGAYYLKDDILEEEGKMLESRYPEMRPLGSGHEGIAYDIGDGKVLKLTFNEAEYDIGQTLIDNPSPHFANVYSVEKLNQSYAIVLEKCQLWDTSEIRHEEVEKILGALRSNVYDLFGCFANLQEITDDNVGINSKGNLVVIDLGIM